LYGYPYLTISKTSAIKIKQNEQRQLASCIPQSETNKQPSEHKIALSHQTITVLAMKQTMYPTLKVQGQITKISINCTAQTPNIFK